MATGEIVPNQDLAATWSIVVPSGAHEAAIDEAHGSPNDSDYVAATNANGDAGDTDDLRCSTIDISGGTVTDIEIFARAKQGFSGGSVLYLNLYDGSGWKGIQSPGAITPSYAWKSYKWSSLSLNQTALDAVRIGLYASLPTGTQLYVSCAYAVVTYTPAAGWGHKFNGVAGANIAKINGIAIANIEKVNGV